MTPEQHAAVERGIRAESLLQDPVLNEFIKEFYQACCETFLSAKLVGSEGELATVRMQYHGLRALQDNLFAAVNVKDTIIAQIQNEERGEQSIHPDDE